MIAYFEKIVNSLNQPKVFLIGGNFLFSILLIALSNAGILPIVKIQDFIFFVLIFLIFALYRPGWAFLFFAGSIALENINLAPDVLGIAIRPYQFIGGITLVAVIIRSFFKQANFEFPKFRSVDFAVSLFVLSGFFSALGALDREVSLRQSVIALSFAALYYLTRIFIQNLEDLKKIVPFFLSSGMVVVLYGIWQNIRFNSGLIHFEVMPGRPNATFTEPDWLGIYLALLIAVVYALIYYFQSACHSERSVAESKNLISRYIKSLSANWRIEMTLLYIILSTSYILLIFTVSRSAWLGTIAVTAAYLLVVFTQMKLDPKEWQWKKTLQIKISILISLVLAIGIVYIFNLTTFQLFNRVASTGTGLQKITIACARVKCAVNTKCIQNIPETIQNVDELAQYSCRHINLEDIQKETDLGNKIMEVYRPDPNVNIRAEIYQKSWEVIKKNPILGIGWGNSSLILGKDERGVALNSSNIFLETWLGGGILGVLALVYTFVYILIKSLIGFRSENSERKIVGLFILLGAFALLIPNLFNAGIFLGILWVFLGISVSLL